MKTYTIKRDRANNAICIVTDAEGSTYLLTHTVLHSPTGFEFGYGGSGPGDLALSILVDYLGEFPTQEELRSGRSQAVRLHQAFKWRFIASMGPIDGGEIKGSEIDEFLLIPVLHDES